jgi:putative membrane protein
VAVVLLIVFVVIYVRATPYKDFVLIAHDNSAVAIALAGAVLGFTLPLVAAIYYTRSLPEMLKWAAITCAVQLLVLLVLRKQAPRIEEGHVSSAIMLATFSIAIGLLNAASISV